MAERETSIEEPPHDVLAAEAFEMPASDPELHHHGPIQVPEDPAGIAEPHDVLAADEFPMPAARQSGTAGSLVTHSGGGWHAGMLAAVGALGLVVLLWLLRRR